MTTTRRYGRGYTGRDANVGLVPNTRAPGARVHARVHARAHTRARVCTWRRVHAIATTASIGGARRNRIGGTESSPRLSTLIRREEACSYRSSVARSLT